MDYKTEYKTILQSNDLDSLVGAKGNAAVEADDWNTSLNGYAQNGWIVKNCGTVASGTILVFWALLERSKEQKGF
ncbi:MAG: hypothetical protein ACQCN3_03630 [Candidatus Bathyarchaeia archaeon]